MEPTSEQELKQLLEEGRISQDEYQQLLGAILRQDKPQSPPSTPSPSTPTHNKYGKAALLLMIAGMALPIVGIAASLLFNIIGIRFKMLLFMPLFVLGLLCELLAFIFGIIGWKTTSGKIAAIGVPCLGLFALIVVPLLLVAAVQFEPIEHPLVTHKTYPLDSLEGVLTQDGIEFDSAVSVDGNGSLKVISGSAEKMVVRLFETGPTDINYCVLFYSAKLKSSELNGNAYLEMWCEFDGKGEFFSRGMDQPVTGTTEWTSVQTPFRLEAGQMPANVKLNLVIEGAGTVWIDEIKLASSPLD